jgi:hypothetical protein
VRASRKSARNGELLSSPRHTVNIDEMGSRFWNDSPFAGFAESKYALQIKACLQLGHPNVHGVTSTYNIFGFLKN